MYFPGVSVNPAFNISEQIYFGTSLFLILEPKNFSEESTSNEQQRGFYFTYLEKDGKSPHRTQNVAELFNIRRKSGLVFNYQFEFFRYVR